MVRQIAPSNAKWMVRATADTMMTSQRKSELDMVRLSPSSSGYPYLERNQPWTAVAERRGNIRPFPS